MDTLGKPLCLAFLSLCVLGPGQIAAQYSHGSLIRDLKSSSVLEREQAAKRLVTLEGLKLVATNTGLFEDLLLLTGDYDLHDNVRGPVLAAVIAAAWEKEEFRTYLPEHAETFSLALFHPDPKIRRLSATGLALMAPGPPVSVAPILIQASREDSASGVRRNLLVAITHLRPFETEFLEVISRTLLDDESESIRGAAARALSNLDPEVSSQLGLVDIYLEALEKESSEFVLGVVISGLGDLGERGAPAIPALEELRKVPELPNNLRLKIEGALRRIGGTLALQPSQEDLIRNLQSPIASEREQASRYLTSSDTLITNDPELFHQLLRLLRESEFRDDVRKSVLAAIVVGSYGVQEFRIPLAESAEPFASFLSDPDAETRQLAAYAFTHMSPGPPVSAAPLLIRVCQEDPDPTVRHRLLLAITHLETFDAVHLEVVANALILDPEVSVRTVTARALSRLDPEVSKRLPLVDVYLEALERETSESVISPLITGVGTLGERGAPAIPALEELLEVPQLPKDLRLMIERVLGKIGGG